MDVPKAVLAHRAAQRRYNKTAKGRATQRKYIKGPKGRVATRKYWQSEHGRNVRAKWRSTVQGGATDQRYRDSEKGQARDLAHDAKRLPGSARRKLLEDARAKMAQNPVLGHPMNNVRRVAIISDIQFPFEDERALDVALQFIESYKPDGVILNGDIADCHDLSDYDRDPRDMGRTLLEVQKCRSLMKSMAHVRHKMWLGGNHEDRWRRVIWRESQRRAGLGEILAVLVSGFGVDPTDVDETFRRAFYVAEHGFEYWPYGHYAEIAESNLIITHGFCSRKHAGATARAHYERLGRCCIVGHCQRLGSYTTTKMDEIHGAWESGCLCQLHPKWIQFPDWQHGLITVDVEGPTFHVNQIPILPGYAISYGGRRWKA